MKKIILSTLFGLIISLNLQGQDDNILLNLNAPAYGVRIKSDFPGYSGGWSRGFFIANESNTQIHLGFGVMGGCSNGITDMSYGWIGRDYNDVFLSFKPNGNIGIGTIIPNDKLSVSAGAITVGFGNNDKATLQGGSGFGSLLRLYYADGKETVRLDGGGGGGTNWINSGNLLIGKTIQLNSAFKLDVAGKIRADEIVVNTTGADFVFEPTYKLRSLSELETFIRTNKHLPDIAPAKEMQENGVSAGEMQAKLLQKVEELTLYVIEKDKQISKQSQIISQQQQLLMELKKEIEKLKQN